MITRLCDIKDIKNCFMRKTDLSECEIQSIIDEIPTAFDIDGIIEKLEEKENEAILKAPNTSDITNPEYQKWMMKSYGFQESIEIVEQGGVDDDVCEWKKHRIIDDVQMYETSCFHELEERCVKKYNYCPYCGKKIKVVE